MHLDFAALFIYIYIYIYIYIHIDLDNVPGFLNNFQAISFWKVSAKYNLCNRNISPEKETFDQFHKFSKTPENIIYKKLIRKIFI